MGCDIHIFAEKKVHNNWVKIGNVFPNSYYDPNECVSEYNSELTDSPYQGRNYDLFSVLADVRNGRGFAGVKTGEGFVPISAPKGLPEDISQEVKVLSDDWGDDGHSHSFFTLEELQSYDWNQITVRQGVITYNEFDKLKTDSNSQPSSWCGWISGNRVVVLEEDEISPEKIQELTLSGKEIYVLYRWVSSYKQCCLSFYEKTLPYLQNLGSSQEVRIVFWFDN